MTVGTGIMHPKLSSKFIVRFSVVFDATPAISLDDASAHLRNLSMQVTAVKIPPEIFGKTAPNKSNMQVKEFRDFAIDEPVTIIFEDDIRNLTQKGIEFISRGDVTGINVLIAKLDGDEAVLEAFYFGSCRLKALTHSEMCYGGSTGPVGTFSGEIVNDTSKDKGTLSGRFDGGTHVVLKELSLTALYTKRAIFDSSMKVTDLAKQTLGV